MSTRAPRYAPWLAFATIVLVAGGVGALMSVPGGEGRSDRLPGGDVASPRQPEAAPGGAAALAPLRGRIVPVGDWPIQWWRELEVSICSHDRRATPLGPWIHLGRAPGPGPVSFRTEQSHPAGPYRVRVAPHGLERVVDFASDGSEAEIAVGPPVTLRVRIDTLGNSLVQEAVLKWSPMGGEFHATSLSDAPFDSENQHFELVTVPGTIWIRIDAPGYRMVGTSTSTGQLLEVRGNDEHVVQLLAAVNLQVSVRYDGRPVRATVQLISSNELFDDYSMTTDQEGIAQFSDVGEGLFSVLVDDLPDGLIAPAAREVWLRADHPMRIELSPKRR